MKVFIVIKYFFQLILNEQSQYQLLTQFCVNYKLEKTLETRSTYRNQFHCWRGIKCVDSMATLKMLQSRSLNWCLLKSKKLSANSRIFQTPKRCIGTQSYRSFRNGLFNRYQVKVNRKVNCNNIIEKRFQSGGPHGPQYHYVKTFDRPGVWSGLSFGSCLATVISYNQYQDVLWACIHGMISWIYVVYFLIFGKGYNSSNNNSSQINNYEMDRMKQQIDRLSYEIEMLRRNQGRN